MAFWQLINDVIYISWPVLRLLGLWSDESYSRRTPHLIMEEIEQNVWDRMRGAVQLFCVHLTVVSFVYMHDKQKDVTDKGRNTEHVCDAYMQKYTLTIVSQVPPQSLHVLKPESPAWTACHSNPSHHPPPSVLTPPLVKHTQREEHTARMIHTGRFPPSASALAPPASVARSCNATSQCDQIKEISRNDSDNIILSEFCNKPVIVFRIWTLGLNIQVYSVCLRADLFILCVENWWCWIYLI